MHEAKSGDEMFPCPKVVESIFICQLQKSLDEKNRRRYKGHLKINRMVNIRRKIKLINCYSHRYNSITRMYCATVGKLNSRSDL